MITLKSVNQGPLGNNTYFLLKENKGICFDPGIDRNKIEQFITKEAIIITAIIITHGHYDHIFSAHYFAQKFNCPIYMSPCDQFLLDDPFTPVHMSKSFTIDTTFPYQPLKEGKMHIAGFALKMIATPGHTPGSICIFIPQLNSLITGDTLFFEQVGRWDFLQGNEVDMYHSIQEKLYQLPDDVKVLPGHWVKTTIGYEKVHNKWIKAK